MVALEIPPSTTSSRLFGKACIVIRRMMISSIGMYYVRADGPKTFSVGEFGWGGTSVKQ